MREITHHSICGFGSGTMQLTDTLEFTGPVGVLGIPPPYFMGVDLRCWNLHIHVGVDGDGCCGGDWVGEGLVALFPTSAKQEYYHQEGSQEDHKAQDLEK